MDSHYDDVVHVVSNKEYIITPKKSIHEIECPFDNDTSVYEENGIFTIKKRSYSNPFRKG